MKLQLPFSEIMNFWAFAKIILEPFHFMYLNCGNIVNLEHFFSLSGAKVVTRWRRVLDLSKGYHDQKV